MDYVIEKIASDIFLSNIKITKDLRTRLTALKIGTKVRDTSNLYESNRNIAQLEASWRKEWEEQKVKNLRKEFFDQCRIKFERKGQ